MATYVYLPGPGPDNRDPVHDCAKDGLPALLKAHEVQGNGSSLTVNGPDDMGDGAVVKCSKCDRWHRLHGTALGEYGTVWFPHWRRLHRWDPFDWPYFWRISQADTFQASSKGGQVR